MGAITAVAATATSSRATRGEAAPAREAGCNESSVVTLEGIVFVPLGIATCRSWIHPRTEREWRIARDLCHGRPRDCTPWRTVLRTRVCVHMARLPIRWRNE